jgi:hypothetical protein
MAPFGNAFRIMAPPIILLVLCSSLLNIVDLPGSLSVGPESSVQSEITVAAQDASAAESPSPSPPPKDISDASQSLRPSASSNLSSDFSRALHPSSSPSSVLTNVAADKLPRALPSVAEIQSQAVGKILSCFDQFGVFPVWFSFPTSKILRQENKTQIWAVVLPSQGRKYIYDKETAYMHDYTTARFGYTWKKGGWDCLRHLEIMAAKCLPVFKGVEACPPCTMVGYPKDLFSEIHRAVTMVAKELNPSWDSNALKPLLPASHPLLKESEWTRTLDLYFEANLKSGSMVKIMHMAYAHKLGDVLLRPPRNVLFVDSAIPTMPDYQSMFTLIGLYEAWPSATIDVAFDVPYLFDDYKLSTTGLYGRGFNYALAINASLRVKVSQSDILQRDRDGLYDLVIYGSITRCSWNLAILNTPPRKRWIIFGEDDVPSKEQISKYSSSGFFFSREIA